MDSPYTAVTSSTRAGFTCAASDTYAASLVYWLHPQALVCTIPACHRHIARIRRRIIRRLSYHSSPPASKPEAGPSTGPAEFFGLASPQRAADVRSEHSDRAVVDELAVLMKHERQQWQAQWSEERQLLLGRIRLPPSATIKLEVANDAQDEDTPASAYKEFSNTVLSPRALESSASQSNADLCQLLPQWTADSLHSQADDSVSSFDDTPSAPSTTSTLAGHAVLRGPSAAGNRAFCRDCNQCDKSLEDLLSNPHIMILDGACGDCMHAVARHLKSNRVESAPQREMTHQSNTSALAPSSDPVHGSSQGHFPDSSRITFPDWRRSPDDSQSDACPAAQIQGPAMSPAVRLAVSSGEPPVATAPSPAALAGPSHLSISALECVAEAEVVSPLACSSSSGQSRSMSPPPVSDGIPADHVTMDAIGPIPKTLDDGLEPAHNDTICAGPRTQQRLCSLRKELFTPPHLLALPVDDHPVQDPTKPEGFRGFPAGSSFYIYGLRICQPLVVNVVDIITTDSDVLRNVLAQICS
eukprot:gene8000-1426_t